MLQLDRIEVHIHFTSWVKKSAKIFFEHVELERKERIGLDAQEAMKDSPRALKAGRVPEGGSP